MASKKIEVIQGEFPDLSQSVIGDVLQAVKDNKDDAVKALRAIGEETRKENEKKITELQKMIPMAPKELVIEALKSNEWNVEAALLPLFNKVEELKQQEKRKQEAELRKKREEEEKARKQAEANKKAQSLIEIFHSIPKEMVQKILDENEGDIEETTNQLLVLVAQQEESKAEAKKKKEEEEARLRQEQEARLKELKITALEQKFEDLSEREVVSALERKNWDIKSALAELMLVSCTKKKEELKALFPSMTEEEIENALVANDWNKTKAAAGLSVLREKKKTEKEQKPTVTVKKVQQDLLERSMLMSQQVETHIEQVQEKAKKEKEEEAIAVFKNKLEDIIEKQARYGPGELPGLAPPPTVKDINERLEKKPQPVDEEEAKRQEQEKAAREKANAEQPPVKLPGLGKQEPEVAESQQAEITLTASPEVVDCDNLITVEWQAKSGSNSNDWIGIFAVDQPNKKYYTYQWRAKGDTTSGKMTFTAPREYGTYEFRYFSNNSYQHSAISNRIKVGPRIELTATHDKNANKFIVKWNQLSGNKYSRSWIGLYEKSQSNNRQYLTYERATTSEIVFEAPVKPQEYEFRFFTNSYEDVARSNAIKVDGADSLQVTYSNGEITIVPNVVTVDPYYDSAWVGIYFTNQPDNRQWRRYKYFTDRTAVIKFKAPRTAGEYEARLFACKTLNVICKSNTFTIPSV